MLYRVTLKRNRFWSNDHPNIFFYMTHPWNPSRNSSCNSSLHVHRPSKLLIISRQYGNTNCQLFHLQSHILQSTTLYFYSNHKCPAHRHPIVIYKISTVLFSFQDFPLALAGSRTFALTHFTFYLIYPFILLNFTYLSFFLLKFFHFNK